MVSSGLSQNFDQWPKICCNFRPTFHLVSPLPKFPHGLKEGEAVPIMRREAKRLGATCRKWGRIRCKNGFSKIASNFSLLISRKAHKAFWPYIGDKSWNWIFQNLIDWNFSLVILAHSYLKGRFDWTWYRAFRPGKKFTFYDKKS